MKINLGQSPLTNVLGLINAKNSSSIVETQVTVDEVIASTENPGDNTKITLTGVNGQGIEGSRSFFYGRVNIESQITPIPSSVALADTDTAPEAKTKIATALAIHEPDLILTNLVLPTAGVPGSVDIKGATDSLLYTDNQYSLVLELQ